MQVTVENYDEAAFVFSVRLYRARSFGIGADGTHLPINKHARLNTFYGYMTVIRERYYDPKGKLLSSSQQFLDLDTQKKKKPGADGEFIDEPIAVYRTVKALPFYTLLSKRAAKTK